MADGEAQFAMASAVGAGSRTGGQRPLVMVAAWWLAVVLGASLAAGCGSGDSPEVAAGPEGTPDPVLVAGREVFIDRCASCHGAGGGGTGDGPGLDADRLREKYAAHDELAAVVAEGRNRMPGFAGLLTADEIAAVLRYVNEVL
ncbi:c-type cytochrome [Candidatus Poriferisocius sp.]|uniref:c-type cytochrome n=1 Tax=Candidatus Poriferisocius sp. TaxID=3101276 RepID=UPI003B5BC1F9